MSATKVSLEGVEAWLTESFRDLGLNAVGAEDDFFELGGTSLAATRLIAKVEETYGEDALPPDDLYEQPRIREIAASIARNAAVAVKAGS